MCAYYEWRQLVDMDRNQNTWLLNCWHLVALLRWEVLYPCPRTQKSYVISSKLALAGPERKRTNQGGYLQIRLHSYYSNMYRMDGEYLLFNEKKTHFPNHTDIIDAILPTHLCWLIWPSKLLKFACRLPACSMYTTKYGNMSYYWNSTRGRVGYKSQMLLGCSFAAVRGSYNSVVT